MKIIQRFIPVINTDTRPGINMVPKDITIHETDNTIPGSDAQAHARLQERGNDRTASWHLQIDDHQAIQSIPFDEIAWAAGDGRNGPGNNLSIHIEICVNSDGDYHKAIQNTAEVTKQLMDQFHIPISNIVQHNHWTGKNCPRFLRSGEKGISWSGFIRKVENQSVSPPELIADTSAGSNSNIPPFVPEDNGIIGQVEVMVEGLNIRQAPDTKAKVNRVANKGEIFDVYANVNDWHNVGGANWIFGNNGQYLSLVRDEPKPPYPGTLIKRGSRGEQVKMVQRLVGVPADGIFGPKTEAAVIAFQKKHGLNGDGIIGSKTWSVLF